MKRTILTLMAAAAVSASALAQGFGMEDDNYYIDDSYQPTEVLRPFALSIGPKVGFVYSMPTNPKDLNLDLKGGAGFSAGLAANVRFGRPAGKPFGTERFGVQLEALYSLRQIGSTSGTVPMNCFEVPVLFQWYFLPQLAVEVGPTFSGAFPTKSITTDNAVYRLDNAKAMDVMLSFGLNCKLKNGFTADLRYNLGNSDIAGNVPAKVSTISVGIGWLFNVIK